MGGIFLRAAARLPIRTFSSGATNSMRGASFLAGIGTAGMSIVKNSGRRNIIVVDVSISLRGDICYLLKVFSDWWDNYGRWRCELTFLSVTGWGSVLHYTAW